MIIVSGNRSGDLDSLVTSYVKSEILRMTHPGEDIHPLIYFDESQWKLHRDAALLFDRTGADIARFLPVTELRKNNASVFPSIYLTDHNHLEYELEDFRSSIVEITDHHKILTPIPGKIKQRIDNTGSCSTLIGEELLEILEKKPSLLPEETLCSLAEMLYFTIRIDTEHLIAGGMYDLDRDRRCLKALKPYVKKEESFLIELQQAKEDTSGYTLTDYFSRDYKVWSMPSGAYGMSTIHAPVLPFLEILRKESSSIDSFMEKRKIDILFLMHFVKDPILKRELTVIPSERFPAIGELIETLNHSDLFSPLKPEKDVQTSGFRYLQHDPHLSRKKIQPFLHGILNNLLEG